LSYRSARLHRLAESIPGLLKVKSLTIRALVRSIGGYTVRKMDLILRSIERMLQTQLSMARRFKLQVLRRYYVKFSKMRNFTLETP
jgi:hypothetical protein